MTPAEATPPSPTGRPPAEGLFLRRDFLPPATLLKMLGALDRLGAHWRPSEALGLLGRGGTWQIRPGDLAVQGQLDLIRDALALPTLRWARSCGFRFSDAPFVALFPVRMIGDAETPAFQEPHRDSNAGQPRPPVCTNVYYARLKGAAGGELAVARASGPDTEDAVVIPPAVNAIATLPGDRVHWVRPLTAGERISVVVNIFSD